MGMFAEGIRGGLKKVVKNIAEKAFDFGIEAATYAEAIKTLFNESYFLEKWISEMLT